MYTTPMDNFLFFPLIGIIAGFLAGLLGIGGGVVIVPALFFLLPFHGLPTEYLMHVAIGTSLAAIIFSALSSGYTHYRSQLAWPWLFLRLLPGLVFGVLLGSVIAKYIPSNILKIGFGCFVLYLAIRMLVVARPKTDIALPSRLGLFMGSTSIGILCAWLGTGGGVMIVPYLTRHHVPIHNAVATSALCTLPIAFLGALGFVISGWSIPLANWSLGYVYLPALLGIAITSIFFAPLGARCARRLPASVLRPIFALLLIVVGIKMFV